MGEKPVIVWAEILCWGGFSSGGTLGLDNFFKGGKSYLGPCFQVENRWVFSLGNRHPPPPEMVRSKFGLTWLGVFSKNTIIC